jgi:uncharacterized C2H2 Zn-finger protein
MMICDTCSLIFHDRSSYVEYLKNHENKFKRILNKFEQLNKTGKLSTDDIQTGSGNVLFEQLNKKRKLSTEDIHTRSETFLFGSFPTPRFNGVFSSFSVSDTGEVLNNEKIKKIMKLNTLSSQTNL